MAAVVAPGVVDQFVYGVYYTDDDCHQPVSVFGFVAGEASFLRGGDSGPQASCLAESLCRHDSESRQCREDLEMTTEGSITLFAAATGECDDCGDTSVARRTSECQASSVSPHCNFRVFTGTELLSHPESITNTAVRQQTTDFGSASYMVFYEDDHCQDVAGVRGILTGRQQLVIAQDAASCADAMTCLFNADGPACQGFASTSAREFLSSTQNKGRFVYRYDPSCDCEVLVEDVCAPSPIPACYYRWISGADLFAHPNLYFTASPQRISPPEVEAQESSGATIASSPGFTTLFTLATTLVVIIEAAMHW